MKALCVTAWAALSAILLLHEAGVTDGPPAWLLVVTLVVFAAAACMERVR